MLPPPSTIAFPALDDVRALFVPRNVGADATSIALAKELGNNERLASTSAVAWEPWEGCTSSCKNLHAATIAPHVATLLCTLSKQNVSGT